MTPEEPERAATSGEVRPFVERVLGALHLQSSTYDDIASDAGATNQAAVLVALSAVAQALGGPERIAVAQIPIALAWAYFSWLVPGTLVWVVGTRALGHTADLPRVLRCVGFATAPQLLWLLGLMGIESEPFDLALAVLIFGLALATSILAIRQAFGVSTLRAVATFALGFLAFAAVAVVIGAVFAALGVAV